MNRSPVRLLVLVVALTLFASSCSDDTDASTEARTSCFAAPDLEPIEADSADSTGTSITLLTHDSFLLTESTLDAFTAETGVEVEVVQGSDAGALVAEAILTRDNPTADVLFGIDSSFLCRGLEESLFRPYESPGLAAVDDALEIDPFHRVTPISFSDVCVNYWTDELPGEEPSTLDDLADPVNQGQFVTQNPETSSPGFAFLLATIATFGEDGWEGYWESLVENDVAVTAGWTEAYSGAFIAGGGERSIVTSYASSPPAEVLFAETAIDEPPTGVLEDSCFRQIEFAGILAGSERPAAAAALIDFMLGTTYQEDIPLNMFVYPANREATLPKEFVEFGQLADEPITMDPEVIEANRSDWTARWTDIVLG